MGRARWVPCALCKQEVDPDAFGTYELVTGWMQKRRQGGGNAVAVPLRHAKFAHADCVDRAGRGLLKQPDLFGQ
jgi:hypothetical protein